MKDIEIFLENKIGQLALLGETLGKNKISLEGGGVVKINEVIVQKLRQDASPDN